MPEIIVVQLQKSELMEFFLDALEEHERRKNQGKPEPIYTINQVAKRLHLSHSTVKSRIHSGMIKTTLDGRIPESAINEYLRNPP